MRPIVEPNERQLHAFLPCHLHHLTMPVAIPASPLSLNRLARPASLRTRIWGLKGRNLGSSSFAASSTWMLASGSAGSVLHCPLLPFSDVHDGAADFRC